MIIHGLSCDRVGFAYLTPPLPPLATGLVNLQALNRASVRPTHDTTSPFHTAASIPRDVHAWNEYHSVLPDENSRKMTISFITPCRVYRYLSIKDTWHQVTHTRIAMRSSSGTLVTSRGKITFVRVAKTRKNLLQNVTCKHFGMC